MFFNKNKQLINNDKYQLHLIAKIVTFAHLKIKKNMNFSDRHIGPNAQEQKEMLKAIGISSLDELIDQTVPAQIRLKNELNIAPPLSEQDFLLHMKHLGSKNKMFNTFIGQGYYGTITPSVIQRNIFENPGWYTAYTPYQAEISQGRLEALLNFQTMILDLTKMEIANASLLDEASAAAEVMIMFYNSRSRDQKKAEVNKFFISKNCFPQVIDVVQGHAENLNIDLIIGDENEFDFSKDFFGAIVQYPNAEGKVWNLKSFIEQAHANDIQVGVGADVLSLVVLSAPGDWGADAVYGNTQRFGVPMGYGGPHAAFLATKEVYKRNIPGRIIGVSVDAEGNRALRMALQTREQHIKRDKATSNICTAQALLAVMAGMYAVYHGPKNLKNIAVDTHLKAVFVSDKLRELGYTIKHNHFFDTVTVELPTGINTEIVESVAIANEINLNYINDNTLSFSTDESKTTKNIEDLLNVFAEVSGSDMFVIEERAWMKAKCPLSSDLHRKDKILTHEVFNTYHTETKMMRYMKKLENKDLSLVHSMISLGSCTMKLNAASELIPLSWPEFANQHPFVPLNQVKGYLEIIKGLEKDLCEITGFAGMSLQPNSGATGEYTGLMVIKAYHHDRGDTQRDICLIPSSAHGTNPASAVMAGMKVVVVKSDEQGNVLVDDLKAKAEQYKNELSCLMITYPSTHGIFEESIIEITSIIHNNGGQVYMDGANMNAQVGLTNPGNIGADVCHLNLHKTFAIPHGGGGPGVGPIGVAKHLVPYLPGNVKVYGVGGEKAIHAVSAAPFGSALVLPISYGYIKMLGAKGLTDATKNAILTANYLKAKLENHYPILYKGKNGFVAHEMIADCRDFKKETGVEVADIAKRLIDYGFHAPTVSFPVAGTLMIEPTESEDKAELDRFIKAMVAIRKEIEEIKDKELDQHNNLLKNAPHTAQMASADEWNMPYTRTQAVYPIDDLKEAKYWVPVRRVDNAYGDRNLICSCIPTEAYAEQEA